MNNYLKDVLDQPASLRKAFESFIRADNLERIKEIRLNKYDRIVFTGMGSSHYCCLGAAIHLSQNGIFSLTESTSQILHYEKELINKRTLLFMVSQSGESGEIVKLAHNICDQCVLVAITNNPTSSLARRGKYVFDLNVADEETVSTRTYLASLILVDLIAKALTGQLDSRFISSVKSSINNLEDILDKYEEIGTKIKTFLRSPPYICLLGRGFSHCTVFAGALFVKELAKYPCIAFDSGEFRHGPFEMVQDGFTAMIFAPEGPGCEMNIMLATDIASRGGKVILVINKPVPLENKNILVIEIGSTDEYLSPIVDIAPVQFVANHLAESSHLDVGKFIWSSKVTRTE
jgi:glutamine---fructose-6-phosphate transaminase (isomerizing)